MEDIDREINQIVGEVNAIKQEFDTLLDKPMSLLRSLEAKKMEIRRQQQCEIAREKELALYKRIDELPCQSFERGRRARCPNLAEFVREEDDDDSWGGHTDYRFYCKEHMNKKVFKAGQGI